MFRTHAFTQLYTKLETRTHIHTPTHTHSQSLIVLLAEDDEALVLAAWSALDALAATIPKEEAPGHVAAAKEAILSAKEKVGVADSTQ